MLKKILNILLITGVVIGLVGCSQKTIDGDKEKDVSRGSSEEIVLYKGEYWDLFSDDVKEKLINENVVPGEEEIKVLGSKIGDWTFEDINGNQVQLPQEGGYVVEVVGYWCGYCQDLTKLIIDKELYKDVPIYQVFISCDSLEQIDEEFYKPIGIERIDDITVLYKGIDFDDYLDSVEIDSVPLMLIVDDNGKIGFTHIGSEEDINVIKKAIEIGLNDKIYDFKVNGVDFPEYVAKQNKAKAYIDSLESIVIEEE